jgi:hypothetical protein
MLRDEKGLHGRDIEERCRASTEVEQAYAIWLISGPYPERLEPASTRIGKNRGVSLEWKATVKVRSQPTTSRVEVLRR